MIEIGLNQVNKNFGYAPVLQGLSLEITSGERVALVGRNGTGKSTILRLIAGEETPDGGTVSVRKGATVGYLRQIPDLLDTNATVHDVLMESFGEITAVESRLRALEAEMAGQADTGAMERLMRQWAHQQSRYEAMDGYAAQENLSRIVTGFALQDILARPFNVLSGGQKTIVMLAKTLLGRPDILLLDEPTNHLDMRALEWFEGFLSKYRGTVLLVSHDRYFLDKVCSKTVLLHRGESRVFHGNYSFSLREQERLLLAEFEQYKTQQKKIEAMQAAIRRYRDWGDRGNNEDLYRKAKELEKRLAKMEMLDKPQLEAIKIPLHFGGGRAGREVLRLEDFSLAIGALPLFSGVTLTVYWQEKVCLLGDNGTGKTSLVRALLGELMPTGGTIKLAASAKIGYIPQEIRFPDEGQTVLSAFREALSYPEGMARGLLAKYSFFGEKVFLRVSSLSGGEKVLLKLAILVQQEVNFLVLDEPTNHIDIQTREMMEDALLGFGGTLLCVSHDRFFISKLGQRVLCIENGRIDSYGGGYDEWRAFREELAAEGTGR